MIHCDSFFMFICSYHINVCDRVPVDLLWNYILVQLMMLDVCLFSPCFCLVMEITQGKGRVCICEKVGQGPLLRQHLTSRGMFSHASQQHTSYLVQEIQYLTSLLLACRAYCSFSLNKVHQFAFRLCKLASLHVYRKWKLKSFQCMEDKLGLRIAQKHGA